MSGRAVAIALPVNENFSASVASKRHAAAMPFDSCPARGSAVRPFLRVPPFPKARASVFVGQPRQCGIDSDILELLRTTRVGGSYWGTQPSLPPKYILIRDASARSLVQRSTDVGIVLWAEEDGALRPQTELSLSGEFDPWHMLAGATMLVASANDELCVVAAVLDVPTFCLDRTGTALEPLGVDPVALIRNALSFEYRSPFTGEPMDAHEAVELCAFWRRLIDANRDIAAAVGFAFWKRAHVAPLLWGGAPVRFLRKLRRLKHGGAVALWRSKASAEERRLLERSNVPVIEIEDGFLRSRGLGADCVPPLSITTDRLGAHFDPTRPSELELLLEHESFDGKCLARAARLRHMIVDARIGKYERSNACTLARPAGTRRHILVPGQVEDDRAVQTGGCGLVSNSELLARVRSQAPDAYILYKPHPDVLAGHRLGAVDESLLRQHADEVVSDGPISSLIDMVDEVHVNTSLTGFEALLREKPVTTYGVPFYAGWGLTLDLGPVPARRTARRTLDELVAAALLIYPRYLDPVTGLPCPAEIVVERLTYGGTRHPGLLVMMRRFQGMLMRRLRSVAP